MTIFPKFNQPAKVMDKLYIFGKVIMSIFMLGWCGKISAVNFLL